MLECLAKNDELTKALIADFNLLRDFFPIELALEVENLCCRIFCKIVIKRASTTFTPRNRRAYILAVFRSFCRRKGRRFTPELLEEINNRFAYQRTIKLYEITRVEKELIDWKLLAPKLDRSQDNLQIFYLNIINNCNLLRENDDITNNEQYIAILAAAQKFITDLLQKKEHKKVFNALLRHKDKDFASRMILWTIAKYFAKQLFNLDFIRVEDLPGWKSLFMKSRLTMLDDTEIPIRTFKYIFWNEFSFRKKLKELNLFPLEV